MSLPTIINATFSIKLGEVELNVKKASLKEITEYGKYAATLQDDPQAGIKLIVSAIKMCALKAYDDPQDKAGLTDDYLMELMPLSTISEEESKKLLDKLGFTFPQVEIKKESQPLGNN